MRRAGTLLLVASSLSWSPPPTCNFAVDDWKCQAAAAACAVARTAEEVACDYGATGNGVVDWIVCKAAQKAAKEACDYADEVCGDDGGGGGGGGGGGELPPAECEGYTVHMDGEELCCESYHLTEEGVHVYDGCEVWN